MDGQFSLLPRSDQLPFHAKRSPSFPASKHRFLELVTTGSEMTFCKLQGWSPNRSAYVDSFQPSACSYLFLVFYAATIKKAVHSI